MIFLGVVVIGLSLLYFKPKPMEPKTLPQQLDQLTPTPSSVDYSAGFAIFTNGTFRIFTVAMYHNRSKDVFIQADNPNVVHVKKAGITWDDFFNTLPMKLTKDCLTTGTKQLFCTNDSKKLQFYLNGVKQDDALNQQIHEGDRLLVTYGNQNQSEIQNQMQKVPVVK